MRRLLPILPILAALAACTPPPPIQHPPSPGRATVQQLLDALTVAEEETAIRYDPAEWEVDARHETEPPAVGCSTRAVLLSKEALGRAPLDMLCKPTCEATTKACWISVYDGRATSDPDELELDRRVSLLEAARSPVVGSGPAGDAMVPAAAAWSPAQKQAFYQDWSNLVLTTPGVVHAKADFDAGEWKPGAESAWCEFASAYAATKVRYRLSVDAREKVGLQQMLQRCPRGYATVSAGGLGS